MIQLDTIDRKILYQLDINSRQSNSQIGRKIGIHKNVVTYRINKLVETGIIKNFYTIIDSFKLGFISLRFLVSFHYAPDKIRKEIISYFEKNKNVWYLAEVEGEYNLVINFWTKKISKFNLYWDTFLNKYRKYIKDQHLSIYTQTHHYLESHILNEAYNEKHRLEYEIINTGDKKDIDDLDLSILKILALDARVPIIDIARKLDSTSTIIKYRINKLKSKKIIQGFRVNIDISKLGLRYYMINIFLKEYSKRHQLLNYVKMNPHVKMIDKSIGGADLIIGVRARNVEFIHSFLKDIDEKYADSIWYYNYFYFIHINRLNFFPSIE